MRPAAEAAALPMHQDQDGIEGLLAELDQIVADYRAALQRVPQEDALRVLQAMDAAAVAADRVRRRYSVEAHEQARRAISRARTLLTEARRPAGQD